MLSLGPIAFTAPWLLLGLVALPVLWILLRAVPPAPIRRRFPGVALLLGLSDDETQSDKTPWWLLLLRTLAVAAVILGFAGPILNPQTQDTGTGPLLVLVDGTWADARDWSQRLDRIEALLTEAQRSGRPVAVQAATDVEPGPVQFQAADHWLSRLSSLEPAPWAPDPDAFAEWSAAQTATFDTYWLSDGVARGSRDGILAALEERGAVRVYESPRNVMGLRPPVYEDGVIALTVLRARPGGADTVQVSARGLDPAGTERELARVDKTFEPGEVEAQFQLSLPPELRNRVSRFELTGVRSAAAVTLTDDALKRREVALIAGRDDREGLELLSPLHYLQQALEPTADLIDGGLNDILLANPDVIVLADVARVSTSETEAMTAWLEDGGLLVRFAGPRLAASDVSRDDEDPLMPVRLREGGRSVGGAMSWGEPKTLRAFAETSPFYGLDISEEVEVAAQVLAQPDQTLASRTIASLADGTPLVTRKTVGDGSIVLFHVTANAEWSTLPLSGLFVQMLERLAVSTRPASPDPSALAGTTWVAAETLDAFGRIEGAETLAGVDGTLLAEGRLSAQMPPGLYRGGDQSIALNVIGSETELGATLWPDRIPVEGLDVVRERQLKGALLSLAILLLVADLLASLWLAGKLNRRRDGQMAAIGLALALAAFGDAQAQTDDSFAMTATGEVALGHVITGNARVDEMAQAGLEGLSRTLFARTSVEPSDPVAVNLETDELAFFPFLYWPVTEDQPRPSSDAYSKLNLYLRTGGMILFDTRDGDIPNTGSTTANGRKLQQLALPLDIPPLEPLPSDHVLTRSFYLLQDFPGRYTGRNIWVEAAPPDAEKVEGMPFRNLNDGVTPVVIGGNDWAAAWAVNDMGRGLYPIGRGFSGERQRELAFRFGVNLITHVLTGNYKSDQVHVPALLDRLGQ